MQSYPVIRATDYVEIGTIGLFDYCEKGFYSSDTANGIITSNTAGITIPVTLKEACFTTDTFIKETGETAMGICFTISFTKPDILAYFKNSATVSVSENEDDYFTVVGEPKADFSTTNPTVSVFVNLNLDKENNSSASEFIVSLKFEAPMDAYNYVEEYFEKLSGFSNGNKIEIQTVVTDYHMGTVSQTS